MLGTLGYMSPEQVRGQAADSRSDIFSFGAILYEMLSGLRAFSGGSAADTMSAILVKEPPDLSVTDQSVTPGLERILRHCLEKNPEERFHSAHDLAFDLEALSGVSAPSGRAAVRRLRHAARKRVGFGLAVLAAVAADRRRGVRRRKEGGRSPASLVPAAHLSAGPHQSRPASPRTARRSSIRRSGRAARASSSRHAPEAPIP